MTRTHQRIALVLAALLALAGLGFSGVFSSLTGSGKTSGGQATLVWSATPRQSPGVVVPAASASSKNPSQSAKPTKTGKPAPAGCGPQQPITPSTFSIEAMDVRSNVLSLGTDARTGAAASPPKNQSRTVGWFNEGPKPGSDKGKVLLTIHTYRNGNALGNALNSEDGLEPGDIIRMSDNSGNTVCYRYREALKVWMKDYYNAPADILYDNSGDPEVAIIICWDFNRSTEEWDSRIIFYADPVGA